MQIRWKTFCVSIVLTLLSFFGLVRYGLTLSLDFTGGTQAELRFEKSTHADTLRSQVKQHYPNSNLQAMGNDKTFLLRLASQDANSSQTLSDAIEKNLPGATVQHVVSVGPQIGKNLLTSGINAMLFALLATLLYISMRFEARFAIAAIVALMHDPIITLGIFSWAGIEFDVVSLAGVLTVLGYSLNDTVVVYDRIRETYEKHPKLEPENLINKAINETLSRTIITSFLTLLSVLALCLFGGESLWGFSLTLIIGIVVGTYSSIYVAGAIALALGLDTAKNETIHVTPQLVT